MKLRALSMSTPTLLLWAAILAGGAACDRAQEPVPGSDDVAASDGVALPDSSDVSVAGTQAQESASAETRGPGPAPDIAYGVAHYPNGRRVGVSQDFSNSEGKNPMWYQYETLDEPAQVLAFYKAEAKKAGYEIKSEKTRESYREISLKAARPGGGVLNVSTIGKEGQDLLIGVHISEDD